MALQQQPVGVWDAPKQHLYKMITPTPPLQHPTLTLKLFIQHTKYLNRELCFADNDLYSSDVVVLILSTNWKVKSLTPCSCSSRVYKVSLGAVVHCHCVSGSVFTPLDSVVATCIVTHISWLQLKHINGWIVLKSFYRQYECSPFLICQYSANQHFDARVWAETEQLHSGLCSR